MRNNVEKIATRSVTSDELDKQMTQLESAERTLEKMAQGIGKIRKTIVGLREQVAEKRGLQKEHGTAQTKRALAAVIKKYESAVQKRGSLLSDYREQKQMVRDLKTLCRRLEKKEEARQKAVARFLKEWERDYDRGIQMKEKTIRKRQRLDKQ
jgi:hypothetical protein